MELIPGGLLLVTTESRFGNSVNGIAGTILPVCDPMYFPLTDKVDEDVPITVTELRYTQFFSKKIAVYFGKFVPLGGDCVEFAGGRGDTQFMSHTFLGSSVSALINPYSTLGGGAIFTPAKDLVITGSIYQSQDSSTTSGFENFGNGWTTDTSVRYQYQLDDKPGGFRLAYEYAFDGDFVALNDRFINPGGALSIPRASESWNAYGNVWQYIYVEDPSDKPVNAGDGRMDHQGVGVFLRAGTADRDTNPIEWTVSGGVGAKGIFPGRDDDTLGIGYGYTKLNDVVFLSGRLIDTGSNRVETYYTFAITPAVDLTLDAQWVDSVVTNRDPATILGVRMQVRF